MAERKATNKYYPPDWTPAKGSINKFRGSHPLRDRARKLHEGILIIRFEMPFNIWCNGCNNHIGQSVRYNAQKSKTGMYYTTPIYKFRMKCHLCDNHFEFQTDPKNLDYAILNGARRQELRWDAKDNEQIVAEDKEVIKKLATDSMFKLEHEVEDKQKAKDVEPAIEQLESLQKRWKDDYSFNRAIRKTFRTKKYELKATKFADRSLLKRSSLPLSLKLIPESKEDSKLAKLMKLESTKCKI
ncbi:coiled-coil domain-containing protein 130 homolog [Oppia nitens]|uniref:coiled-coil domain-containing protein 130 homolog n=1 Tax=Oppia nitens TaxID=1686743 RepID=UPI0023DA2E8A|nr:coiled-coil domain-containing protein 130 homolog [Oppia nitens]